ncbi:MAG TPA: hypothetical protein VGK24_18870 [Candidatus Angelobacter sp.]|jgi:hypothetical protein
MEELTPLIPGVYADAQGCVLLNMREFLAAHDLPDTPRWRAAIREEIQDIFGDVEVIEIPGERDNGGLDS